MRARAGTDVGEYRDDGAMLGCSRPPDYDCSMSKDGSPDQPGDAPFCAGECTGSGFRPTGRSGPDVNPICGSTELVECSWLFVCSEAVSSSPAKRCPLGVDYGACSWLVRPVAPRTAELTTR
jgi:hypothetical protein